MSFLEAIILGIVEGITEFLPISSTAHLMMASKLLSIAQSDFVKSFEIVIQFGAIAAVILVFAPRLLKNRGLWKKIIIAFIPTAIIGFALYKLIKVYLLGNLVVALSALIIGGIVLIWVEKYIAKREGVLKGSVEEITNKEAFFIGLAQSLAVIPGVSRSATTLIPALLFGSSRKTATEFSFLLAIPTVAAAAGYDLVKNIHVIHGNFSLLLVGFVASFISALVAIKFLLTFIEKYSYIPFGIYRIIIGVIFLLFFL